MHILDPRVFGGGVELGTCMTQGTKEHLPRYLGGGGKKRLQENGSSDQHGTKVWRWRSEETRSEHLPRKVAYSESPFSPPGVPVMAVALPSSQAIVEEPAHGSAAAPGRGE